MLLNLWRKREVGGGGEGTRSLPPLPSHLSFNFLLIFIPSLPSHLALHLHTRLNLSWDGILFAPLQVGIKSNDARGCKGQGYEVSERKPEPHVCEYKQAYHCGHMRVSRARLQRDGHVSSTFGIKERELVSIALFSESRQRKEEKRNTSRAGHIMPA